MKKNLLVAFALIISITACKKDKPMEPEIEERKPEVLISGIAAKLAGADSISTFTNALKNIKLTADEAAQGITVFAPLNGSAGAPGTISRISAAGSSSGTKTGNAISAVGDTARLVLTDSVLRDHIVKGVFKLADLTNGRVFTGLSGKQLKVSRSADTIWINGVRIGGKEIVNTNNEVVYTVKSALTATAVTDELQSTSLEITVWDSTRWSTANVKGEVSFGSEVWLFKSQKDYADSISAYHGVTNAQGKVIFKSITPGTYYLKVSAGDRGNIFNRSAQKTDGLYRGFASAGIFQTQAEINAAPNQTGAAIGRLKWLDANQDGVINDNDRVNLPYENAVVVSGVLKKTEVTIGQYLITPPSMTEQEFSTGLLAQENNIATWHKNLVVVDGLLSHQAVIDSIPIAFRTNFQSIGTFTFNASNSGVTKIWQEGYQYIAALNGLQDRAPATFPNRAEKIARLRAMRAYVYLQLLSYYGNIPLIQTAGNLVNNNRTAVVNFIATEFQAAAGALPASSSSTLDLNANSVKALHAKAALLEKDYVKADDLTTAIMNGGQYALAQNDTKFTANSAETMWNNSTNLDVNVKTYFMNRTVLPYIRFTEVYLMNIEANLALGNTTKAQNAYAVLLQRSGTLAGQINNTVFRQFWQLEMRREGHAFLNLRRWGIAADELTKYGFAVSKNNLLPIPQVVIDQNPGMVQNAGY
jgi:hypothetical protein